MRKLKCKGILYQHNRGAATILITMLILSFIMATSGIVARLMVQEIRMGRDIVKSFKAYEGAIGGLENGSKIVKDNISHGLPASNGLQIPISPPDQSYQVSFVDPAGNLFSRGLKDNLERQIEMSVYDVVAVAAGNNHSLALRSDGSVWAWGDNSSGQLGDGSNNNSSTPIRVGVGVVDFKNIKAIAAGDLHSLALKNDGTVWTWGGNNNCQLGGNGVPPCGTNSLSPIKVQKSGGGDLANIVSIRAGLNHSLAIQKDGVGVRTVWSWGSNSQGQLGNSAWGGNRNFADKVISESGVGDLNNITSIAAGGSHSIAIQDIGGVTTVWSWGGNSSGQLGNNRGTGTDPGTNDRSAKPIKVRKSDGAGGFILLDNIQSVASALGGLHSLALKGDGTVWTWGDNTFGQLGDGSTTEQLIAAQVPAISGALAVYAGSNYSFAVVNTSGITEIWSWGESSMGQLGRYFLPPDLIPRKVVGVNGSGYLEDVNMIAGGNNHTLAARLTHGEVLAWGDATNGKLGDGVAGMRDYPIRVDGF